MGINELVEFDLRKTYLTNSQLKFWEENNILFNTLWFDMNIGGPDVEFSYIAQKLFTINEKYNSWTIVPKNNAGYSLKSESGIIITSDVMSGRWEFMKRLMKTVDCEENTRQYLTNKFYTDIKDIRKCKGEELCYVLTEKYGHDREMWKNLLSYLDVVYPIGNLTPAGANPGGNGYDNWVSKLKILYEQYFFGQPTSEKSIIHKWIPLLSENYIIDDHDDQTVCKAQWKKYIEDNLFQPYVDESLEIKVIDFNDLKKAIKESRDMILERGELIRNNDIYSSKQYSLIDIPFGSIGIT